MPEYSDPDSQPLLCNGCDQIRNDHGKKAQLRTYASYSRKTTYSVMVHVVFMLIYTGAVTAVLWSSRRLSAPELLAFNDLVVKYEMKTYNAFQNSPFAGDPRPESDLAWHDLMENMTIRVSKEELDSHNKTSIELPNGGYMAWLGVFHEVHCVKMLRHWAWRDHYMPNLTSHETAHHLIHIDHCVELLRNSALCRADTESLTVFRWDSSMPQPTLNLNRTPRRCVNWDALMNSHKGRVVSRKEVEEMENPVYELS